MKSKSTKGFKVTNSEMKCRGYQYELNKEYTHNGRTSLCNEGFHFCQQAQHCFNYYDFDTKNRVFEVEALGKVEHGDDKSVTDKIVFLREIPWDEVLRIANTGANNTGHSNSGNWNSGDRNSGYRNSGDRNSGYRNSGNWNSGDRNSGDRNSGYRNSGDRNSGNWNSGDRNSGDSNSGYRNSGAFCTDKNPTLFLFNKPTKMTMSQWENSRAVKLMYSVDPNIWIPSDAMTSEEKGKHPSHETTGGYLKRITMKEAWANAWHNWNDESRREFTSLENFDSEIFEEITGIKIK